MSDHEAKSRSIKELKVKKHHEKLSLLEDLKLNFLTRMHTSTRYPSEDLPTVKLFDQSDGEE